MPRKRSGMVGTAVVAPQLRGWLKAACVSDRSVYLLIGSMLFFSATSHEVVQYPDSGGYLAWGSGSFGKFSLTGESIRAWPTMLIFLGGPTLGVALQYSVYAFACAEFCKSLKRLVSPPWQVPIVSLALLFLLARNSIQWQSIVLSEGLTNSLTVLAVAYAIRFADEVRVRHFAIAVAAAGLAFVNRPTQAPLLALVGAFGVVILLKRSEIRSAAAMLALVLISVFYGLALNANINDHWAEGASGFTRSSVNFSFLTASGARDSRPDQLFSALRADPDVPRCITSIRADMDDGPFAFQNDLAATCPRDVAWINDSFQRWYLSYLIRNPGYIFFTAAQSLGVTGASWTDYAEPWSPVPPAIEYLFTGIRSFPALFPAMAIWFVASALGLVMAVRHNRRVSRIIKGHPRQIALAIIVFVASAGSIVLANLQMNIEMTRIGKGGATGVFLAYLLFGTGLISAVGRSKESESIS